MRNRVDCCGLNAAAVILSSFQLLFSIFTIQIPITRMVQSIQQSKRVMQLKALLALAVCAPPAFAVSDGCTSLDGNWTSSHPGTPTKDVVHIEFFQDGDSRNFTLRASVWGSAVRRVLGASRPNQFPHLTSLLRLDFPISANS